MTKRKVDTLYGKDEVLVPPKKRKRKPGVYVTAEKKRPLMEAVCDQFGLRIITSADASRIWGLARGYFIKGATPRAIQDRRFLYLSKWPGPCTPEALLRHWDTFAPSKSMTSARADVPEGKYGN